MCKDLRWRDVGFVAVVEWTWYEFAHDVYSLVQEEPMVKYGADETVCQILPTKEGQKFIKSSKFQNIHS